MAVSCIILEIKRDIGKKSLFFHTLLAFGASVRGSPSEFCLPVWHRKTKMMDLPGGEKSLTIWLPVSTESTNVTDGRTDGQTDTA